MVLAAAVLLAASLMWALVRYRGLRPLDASLPVFDEHGVAVPRAVPTPATDLDTAGHLVVEAVD
jgi:hypothetical protein